MEGKRMRRGLLVAGIAGLLAVGPAAPAAHADYDLVGAVGDVVVGALAIPVDTIAGTLTGPPILGTVGGLLHGVLRTIGMTSRGLLRIAGMAVPVATSLAPFLPLVL